MLLERRGNTGKGLHLYTEFMLGSVKKFKITFGFAHQIPDRILRRVESEQIYYSFVFVGNESEYQ
jgi:hypothetical protein